MIIYTVSSTKIISKYISRYNDKLLAKSIQNVGDSIKKALEEITNFDGPTLRNQRRERFITLGNDFLSS